MQEDRTFENKFAPPVRSEKKIGNTTFTVNSFFLEQTKDGVVSKIERLIKDDTPFRNIINGWYAKDTSKKIRAVMKIKGNAGELLTTNAPYTNAADALAMPLMMIKSSCMSDFWMQHSSRQRMPVSNSIVIIAASRMFK